MNIERDLQSGSEQQWLDRLVDDELAEDERRELLTALELQPEGWRRCALAFLEAQAWRRGLRDMTALYPSGRGTRPSDQERQRHVLAAGDGQDVDRRSIPSIPHRRRSHSLLVMAASVLLSFTLGVASQALLWGTRPIDQTASNLAPRRQRPPQDSRSLFPPPPTAVAQQRGMEEALDWHELSAMRLQLLHQERGLVPFRLEDGRQAIVPVEDLYVWPINQTTY